MVMRKAWLTLYWQEVRIGVGDCRFSYSTGMSKTGPLERGEWVRAFSVLREYSP